MTRTVACVLRSGGVYTAEWVGRLQRAAERFLRPHRFVCLSDVPAPCERIPLAHDFPGWWAKVELFRPGLFDGTVLFVDLDTLLLGDCRELWSYAGTLAALRDFTRPDLRASGLLLWKAGEVDLYERALADRSAGRYESRLFVPGHRMDPWWNKYYRADVLQDLYPGMIGSFKVDGLEEGPKEHRIVCFHGLPKPEDVQGWVAEAWAR